MSAEQAAEHSNSDFKHLDLRVDVERDVIYDLADGLREHGGLVQDDEGVQDIDQSESIVARDVVDAVIGRILSVVTLSATLK